MKYGLTKQNYGRQSHFIVNAKYSMTRGEIDLILALIASISKEDKDFKDYIFSIEDLENRFSRKLNSKQLKDSVESLFAKPLKIEVSKNNWKIFNWFSYFEFKNGMITCRFDKALKPYLLEIKNRFVIHDLRMILPMRSSYSKRIYLMLKEYAKIGKRTFRVEDLQNILLVPDSHRKRYNKFKDAVLKRAEADINKFTDLEVKLSEKKLGRKVVEVTYTIKKNTMDLRSFIETIRELYPNELLHHTKDGRPLKCDKSGYLYYADNTQEYINKKEAKKLWEYLHENRENLYLFKKSTEELERHIFLANIEFFKNYLKQKFVHKSITKLKKGDMELDISIFPNGRLYDRNGEILSTEEIYEIWDILYNLAKEEKLNIFKKE